MAYLDRTRTPHRAGIVAAVVCIEALTVIAIVRGLDVHFLPREESPPLVGTQIDLPPPPKPEHSPRPQDKPDLVQFTPLAPPLDLGANPIPARPDPLPLPLPTFVPQPDPLPSADPHPIIPRAARPIGNPAKWVSTNDYPARDLREGNQGTTGFELSVGSDGRVLACAITRSSGFPGLDRATCDALVRRARFAAATDENGATVSGRYANAIRWVIPAD